MVPARKRPASAGGGVPIRPPACYPARVSQDPPLPDVESRPKAPPPAAAPAPRDAWGLVRIAAAVYGAVLLFSFGMAFLQDQLGILFGEAWPSGPHLLAGLGVGLALVVLSRVAAHAWPPMTRLVDGLTDAIGPIGILPALALAALSGVAEEVLFRGALWPGLGFLGTSILFGLVHVWPSRAFWVYPLFATAAGLLFGLLRLGTQSLWPGVLAHVTVNALNLVWLGRRARRRQEL